MIDNPTLTWLLEGDPAIRWQVQHNLLAAAPETYEAERAQVAEQGWGAALLARQDPSGTWGRGLYSPKWISTTYTLLLLRHLGLPQNHPQAQQGCAHLWSKGLYRDGGINIFGSFRHSETCVNGMFLALLSYFRFPDERIHSVVEFLLGDQMADGGWNCQRYNGATHASFHTTISVLEGLLEYRLAYPQQAAETLAAAARAHDFLLQHRLYHSHRTGEIVDPTMLRMNFPPRWHYDYIRALDYFQSFHLPPEARMTGAIELLQAKRGKDNRWQAYSPWPGRVFFQMEKAGEPSRWNTLRALRVLQWWETNPPV